MWVIRVFSSDRRKPIAARTPVISSRSLSASALAPRTIRHQSSAYAELRVMPTLVPDSLVAGWFAVGWSA